MSQTGHRDPDLAQKTSFHLAPAAVPGTQKEEAKGIDKSCAPRQQGILH